MTGELLLRNGKSVRLPELTACRLIHTDGRSADSFEVTFPTKVSLLPELRLSREFRCTEGGVIRFRGVIDEVETVYADAFTTTLCGRGLAAKLMDNQADGAEFYTLDLETVLARYVRPCGITDIVQKGGPWRIRMASVGTGCSCFRVLEGFCLHAGAPRPRFLPDGTLCISAQANTHKLGEADVLSAGWRLCRYGVISRQKVIDMTMKTARIAENPRLSLLDVSASRVAARAGQFTHLTERTAQQRLDESLRELDTLELTVAGAHPALPCDVVNVTIPRIQAFGDYIVTETCRSLDLRGETTRLSLRAKEV